MAPVEAPSVLRDLSGRRAVLQQVIRFSIAVAIAASIATLLVMAIPSSQRPAGQDTASLSAAWQSVKSSVLPAPQPAPPPKRTATLAVQDGSGFANDPVPLGIHVGAPPPGAFVSINGLTAGARLTSGKRVGPNEWRVPATEISGVSVIPPDGFTGQMLVTAELRDGDGVALTGTSTRLTWQAAAQTAALRRRLPPQPPSRRRHRCRRRSLSRRRRLPWRRRSPWPRPRRPRCRPRAAGGGRAQPRSEGSRCPDQTRTGSARQRRRPVGAAVADARRRGAGCARGLARRHDLRSGAAQADRRRRSDGGRRPGPHLVSAGQGMGRTRRAAKAGRAGALALISTRRVARARQTSVF